MKNAMLIIAIIATALSALETYLGYEFGESFIKALNNFFTYCAIISTILYLYLS